MSDVKWIKVCTDIFSDEKIVLIESMPDADAIIVIWFKLLCLAGVSNSAGLIMMSNRVAYTDEMLAAVFHRPLNTVKMALQIFETYGMIEIEDDAVKITNWSKHQNVEGMEHVRELNRNRQQRFRDKKKAEQLPEPEQMTLEDAATMDVPAPPAKQKVPYEDVIDAYHATCTDLPRVQKITAARKRTMAARYKDYGMDGLQELFNKAAESDFLNGRTGDGGWRATFDWIMKPANAVKVIEGNYANRGGGKIPDGTGNPFMDMLAAGEV